MHRPTLLVVTGTLTGALLGLSGCSDPSDAPRSGPRPDTSTSGAVTTLQPTPQPTPRPTTHEAWASIGQLDPCKLSAAGRPVTFKGRPAKGATTCTTWTATQNRDVVADVGAPWTAADVAGLTRTSVAGFEAWVGARRNTCFALVPADGTSVRLTARDQPDCTELIAQVTTVLTRLRTDPHAWDLAAPRPVACQLLAGAGLKAASDSATACTAGNVTAWLIDTGTYADDKPVRLGAVRGIQSRRLPETQALAACSIRWTVAAGIQAAVLAPTCGEAVRIARASATQAWRAPDPGALAFTPAD